LLARNDYKVLLFDRDTFLSDHLSTHWIHQPGVARLERWGLRQRLAATGCPPPITSIVMDFGPFALRGTPPLSGTAEMLNIFRQPVGAGWALMGDAGYHKDPITAQGITDALRGAELLAEVVDAGVPGRRKIEDAMADYEQRRNESAMPVYDLTC